MAASPISKAPPMPAAAASWTGFYVGGNIGLSVGRNPSTHTETFINPNPAFNDASANTFKLAPFGVIGGGQVGYNWQAAPSWVLGIEADFQGSGQSDTACVFQCTFPAIAGFDRHESITQRLDWLGTVRGRVGWTNGPVLFYGTGGLAYGRVRLDQSWSEFNFGAGVTAAASTTQTKSGWTAGVGAEAQLFGNWTAKLEYLYVDLGSMTGATFVFPAVGNVLIAERHDFSTTFRDHIVRLGLNYKFGDPVYVAPATGMSYKAPPAAAVAYDWTGFYVGGNVGLSVARDPTSTPFNTINNTTGVVGAVFFAERFTLSPWGAIGGGQIGYNRQVAPNLVLGLEADFQGGGQKDSACVICRTPRAVQRYLLKAHGREGFEAAERGGVTVLGDCIGLIEPQNIVSEAAHSREDAGVFSDA
jgi:outer membrane immunogenic protein